MAMSSSLTPSPQDTAKIVKEKYIERADGDINFNMIVLAGEGDF
jgi:ubiquitin carboxyl-terminal hydrolase L3